MKNKTRILLLLCSFFSMNIMAQNKIAELGFGIKPSNDKGVFSFNFSFNRTEASEPEPGGYLWSKNKVLGKHDRIYMKPSAEANLGNIESSPNNILLELPVQYTIKVKPGQSFFFDLAPAFNASKTLDTGLYYLEAGPKYLFYAVDVPIGFQLLPEFKMHVGKRYNKTVDDVFIRYHPSLKASLFFIKNENKTYQLEVSTAIGFYFVKNDRLAPKNNMHLFSGSVTYKFKNIPIGLTAKYINGYEQPLYQKLDALTLGIAFYKR